MLRPRFRNISAITLSRGNRDFSSVSQTCRTVLLDHKEFIEFISPIVSCACETDIALKLKNSSDVHIKLVEGEELSEAGELIEIALDVTFNPNTPFPLFVRTVTNSCQTLSRNTRKTRKNLKKLEFRLKPNTFR